MFKSPDIGKDNEITRNIWIEQQLKSLPAGLKILDAGAGECQYKKYCGHLDYTSQDFAQYDGSGNNRGLQMKKWDNSKIDIVSDIIAIPVKDNSFDAALCTEVLEHLPDPISALKEICRVLKNNGHLIITAPFCSLTHFAPYHFSTGFNKYFYDYHLPKLGFEIIEMKENGDYYSYLAQEIRRLPEIQKKYSKLHMNYFYKMYYYFLSYLFLKILYKFHRKNAKSEELLTFGYHIHAVKKY